jgi:hypothetical protein
VDAADFIIIEGGAPRFDVSDQATLHLEDTTPLAIGTAGAPATVAAPVRSLFQTDSMASFEWLSWILTGGCVERRRRSLDNCRAYCRNLVSRHGRQHSAAHLSLFTQN